MPSRSKIVLLTATTLLLLAGGMLAWRYMGSNDASDTTQAAEQPGRAVIYPDGAQGKADVAAALAQAAREHKRVLLDFGGNWCGDCQVLAIYFQDPANRDLLASHYVMVPVNIGRYDVNLDLAAHYGVPIAKGVPALAVLDANGTLLYSQRNSEFSSMRNMDVSSVTAFLNRWKG